MIFVDTNYFLRFLLKDVKGQHRQAKDLFKQAALGTIKLLSSSVVFFEIFWVLVSVYDKKKTEIIKTLENILKMDFIKWENEAGLQLALNIYKSNSIELEDSYNLAFMKEKNIKEIRTFDKKLAGVHRNLSKLDR
ncbi:MAG: PIN domain-containing protein [Patescibacteria group bacterium]|nr:PIN domain-containing protein [Patescibacteria group bacterium]